jgi:adenylate cyclase
MAQTDVRQDGADCNRSSTKRKGYLPQISMLADSFLYNAPMGDFLEELKRRKVIRVVGAYIIVGWLLIQIAETTFEPMGLPSWALTLIIVLVVMGLPLATILAWAFDITPSGIEKTEGIAVAVPTSDSPSIAVLPFPDMSAEKDQEHFCDGLTEELLNVLTRIPNLRVASRTSSFSFKGKTTDLKAAAEKLQVAHILEGSVRKSGNKIRVTAQLIEAETDSHLWSETYDRELDDIFAIQDDIAAKILVALQCRLGTSPLCSPTTDNPKAYEYFLRGRGYAIAGGDRDIAITLNMFQKAVDIDPTFVRAWISLAEQCMFNANFFSKDEQWRRLADKAAAKAMELAPGQAESFLARAYAHAASDRFAEAELDLRKVLELDPKNGRAWHNLGRAVYHQGKIRQAIESFEKATEHDPDDYESPLLASTMYEAAGDDEGARRNAEIGVERAEKLLQDYPDNQRAYYLGSGGLVIMGQHDRGKEWIERALELGTDDSATRYNAACFFSKYGDIDRALDLLENSVISRTWIENDSDLDPLRDHPKYTAILAALPE